MSLAGRLQIVVEPAACYSDGVIQTRHRCICSDARDLSMVQDESAHLVVTSPPYPMIAMWDSQFSAMDAEVGRALEEGDAHAAFEGMHAVLDEVWSECFRVLVPGGFACINIGDATRSIGGEFRLFTNHSRITASCERLGFRSLPAILWRKTTNAPNKFMGSGMLPAGAYITLEHEYVLVFRKGHKREFTPGVERDRRMRSAYFWEERNSWFSDLWEMGGARQDRPHRASGASAEASPRGSRQRSAAFPLLLARRLILMYSLQGDLVIDPFCGTGTTQRAALGSARNSIGIDSVPELVSEARAGLLGCKGESNLLTAARLADHEQFVRRSAEQGSLFKHSNRIHGFRVKTLQETGALLLRVTDIENGADITAYHEAWPATADGTET